MCSAAAAGSFVRITITDSGIGIPPEHLPFVWDRFYKIDTARTPSPFSGTGLGLAIVRQLVSHMGGQVDVTSTPSEGSTFSFTLPAPAGG